MSVTGIVAALTAEARTLGPVRTGTINTLPDGNLLIVSGMGSEAAVQAALALVAAGARGLLSFGLAGALDPGLGAGVLLLPESVIDGTGAMHATSAPWRARLAAVSDALVVVGGTLLSVAQPLSTTVAKSQAWRSTAACAVDTESFAIATVAARTGVEFAVARVVVDAALDTLPRSAMRATGPRGEVSVPRLLAGLVRSPAEARALLRLAQRYRVAMRSLRYLGQRGVGLA